MTIQFLIKSFLRFKKKKKKKKKIYIYIYIYIRYGLKKFLEKVDWVAHFEGGGCNFFGGPQFYCDFWRNQG